MFTFDNIFYFLHWRTKWRAKDLKTGSEILSVKYNIPWHDLAITYCKKYMFSGPPCKYNICSAYNKKCQVAQCKCCCGIRTIGVCFQWSRNSLWDNVWSDIEVFQLGVATVGIDNQRILLHHSLNTPTIHKKLAITNKQCYAVLGGTAMFSVSAA